MTVPVVSEASRRLALRNVAQHGDTDIFPLPLELTWFFDAEDAAVRLLGELDSHFDQWMATYPVLAAKALVGVGYSGFRAATQIDPIWNAYLLSLVVEIAPDVERARLDHTAKRIFSYRYAPDPATAGLFSPDLGWTSFQAEGLLRGKHAEIIVGTDISDFYTRIYHHKLENALDRCTQNKDAAKRITDIISKLSGPASYGLPIGGNAARLLAEIVLNAADRLLMAKRVDFIRFVDDYYLFCPTREEAHRALVVLSDVLLHNEGLTLSRGKTRLMTRSEFLRVSPLADPDTADSEEEAEGKRFLRIRLSYDPYSDTAEEDYDRLAEELDKFDILSMLAREFRKTRVDETLVKQLVKSVRFLSPVVRDRAVQSLLDNVEMLYPVFPTLAILLRRCLADLSEATRARIFAVMRSLFEKGSHITMIPVNRLFAVRLLAYDDSDASDPVLVAVYDEVPDDMMVRRDVILAMARRRRTFWLSDVMKRYARLTPWERRALLAASYGLGDEGRHWRDEVRRELSPVDRELLSWIGQKNNGRLWELPL
jgi:hypothetical protein